MTAILIHLQQSVLRSLVIPDFTTTKINRAPQSVAGLYALPLFDYPLQMKNGSRAHSPGIFPTIGISGDQEGRIPLPITYYKPSTRRNSP